VPVTFAENWRVSPARTLLEGEVTTTPFELDWPLELPPPMPAQPDNDAIVSKRVSVATTRAARFLAVFSIPDSPSERPEFRAVALAAG
jgi:hypothetical protein